ncbi:MAG: LD-carboxypeptidase [Clostridia bacterium]|nr:LD-carboxypeptidase [Clostridia bacterium]
MIYPKFLKESDYIGVTAPSDGIAEEIDIYRLNNAIKKIEELKYKIKETNNVRTSIKGKSAPSKVQAKELEDLFKDEKIKCIICAGGGDFLLEMLSEVDFRL